MSKAAKKYSLGGALAVLLASALVFGMAQQPAGPASHDGEAAAPGSASGAVRTLSDLEATEPVVYSWQSLTTADGLPSNKIFAVRVDGDRVWFGTDHGLVLYEQGAVQHVYTQEEGLAHDAVIAIDVDRRTGTVWAGTMAGLSAVSGGSIVTYTQMNSGLTNNMIYAVYVDGDHVWTATAAGASDFNTRTGQWRIFNEQNAPMHEPWTYGLTADEQHVYVGAWGGGLLEWDKQDEHWKDYRDPDAEMELDIFPDDGVVHDIISGLSYDDGIVWVATYFGLSLFDGARWKGYFADTSGLISDFINYVYAYDRVGYLCTDRGLSAFDGKVWRNYTRREDGRGQITILNEAGEELDRITTATAINHNFVLGADRQGDVLWVATEDGVARGVPERTVSLAALGL